MKLLSRYSLLTLLCITSYPAASDNIMNSSADTQNISNNTSQIATYLLNLGAYLGFDLSSKNPPQPPKEFSADLIKPERTLLNQQLAFSTLMGAIPVSFMPGAMSKFLPPSVNYSNVINGMANATFSGFNGDSSSQNSLITANPLIDEPTQGQGQYLTDPVSQSVYNILGTPDFTYCMDNDGQKWLDKNKCSYLYQNQVTFNILGYIPNATDFFSYNFNGNVINQLNSNSLLAPLMYSSEQMPQVTIQKDRSGKSSNPGLVAQNQAQQADNFVRYVSGSTVPTALPSFKQYNDLYALATQSLTNPPDAQQMQAQATLANYLGSLRVYAAQSSVGISNLYYIMSKRLPQKMANEPTSQALTEFNMATRRLFVPDSNNSGTTTSLNKQWTEDLNNASSATIQKEIAVLLAEINYQMYLDRQIQERMLLTNTIILMQNLKASQPSPDFGTQGTDASSTETSSE